MQIEVANIFISSVFPNVKMKKLGLTQYNACLKMSLSAPNLGSFKHEASKTSSSKTKNIIQVIDEILFK